ncbi:hypothetical protein PIG75_07305, partial [Streptococcus thermophilus]|nr:hypothetical protein [Streptococcus thermophilus]
MVFSEASIILCECVEDLGNFLLRLKRPHSVDDSHQRVQARSDSLSLIFDNPESLTTSSGT